MINNYYPGVDWAEGQVGDRPWAVMIAGPHRFIGPVERYYFVSRYLLYAIYKTVAWY